MAVFSVTIKHNLPIICCDPEYAPHLAQDNKA